MTIAKGGHDENAERRRRAEEIARRRAAQSPGDLEALSNAETRRRLHELQVHQIELELQNEELREAQAALGASQARYSGLYDPAPAGCGTLNIDLTERRVAERALRESEERFQLSMEATHDGLWDWNITTDKGYFSPGYYRMLGYEAHAFAEEGKVWKDLIHPEDREPAVRANLNCIEGRCETFEIEYRMKARNGGWRWILGRGKCIARDPQGRALRLVGTHVDITERKRAEEALRESEANFRAFFETIEDLIVVATPEGGIVYANPACARKLGFSAKELATLRVLDLHPADKRAEAREIFAAMFRGERKTCPLPLATKSGALLPAETRVWFGRWNGADCVFGLCKDLRAEQEAQQRFERLFRHNPALMAMSTVPERRFFDVNDAFLKTLGYGKHQIVGKTAEELGLFVHSESLPGLAEELLAKGRIDGRELQVRHRTGAILDGLFSGELISSQGQQYFLTVMIDLTEHKRAEAEKENLAVQNRRLQKAESLGRMAGAIAHHFNNQLQAVMMNLEMALRDLPGNTAHAEQLTEAMQSASKAAEVSGRMLIYLGQTVGQREPLDLSEACRQSLSLMDAVMPKSVVLETALPCPGPTIRANDNQIQQVLTNLVTNAWEAIGDAQGRIRLSVKTVPAAEIPATPRFPIDWRPHDPAYGCLEVLDTGCGIPATEFEKLFDPFFSSKFAGRGLGLPVVLGIVRAHQGGITVASEPGRGSIFRVFLPVSLEALPRKSAPSAQAPATAWSGTVLVVDDETSLRMALTVALKGLGFTVLAARDGVEAVAVFGEHRDDIRAVLCDLTMPRMNGWETLAALRRLAPGLPVILSSGYNEAQVAAGHHPEQPQAFLSKPYEYDELIQAIARVLTLEQPSEPHHEI